MLLPCPRLLVRGTCRRFSRPPHLRSPRCDTDRQVTLKRRRISPRTNFLPPSSLDFATSSPPSQRHAIDMKGVPKSFRTRAALIQARNPATTSSSDPYSLGDITRPTHLNPTTPHHSGTLTMCQQHHDSQGTASKPAAAAVASDDPFPWSEGVFDAHCHPTDTMSSLDNIPKMKAAVLTVMSTRSQDQTLVADAAASTLGLPSKHKLTSDTDGARIVPCFGWHPWFSHQLYDDSGPREGWTYQPPSSNDEQQKQAAKLAHYAAVLQPSPGPDDIAFLDSLPEPRPLSSFISDTRARLEQHPLALVGEVGLDKAFRLPEPFDESSSRDDSLTPGTRNGRLLSPHHVRMPHQIAILNAQLALAAELGRAVSVHGVQAHGILHDTLAATWKGHEKEVLSRRERRRIAPGAEDFSSSEDEDDPDGYRRPKRLPCGRRRVAPAPFVPRICLHSFSGADQMMKQYLNPAIPVRIFFSFSQAINLSEKNGEEKFAALMKACPDDRILVESDLHIAGQQMDDALEAMYRKVCEVKGWDLEEGVRLIRRNYEEFIFG